LIEKETITFKNEDVIPNQDEIGTLKEGWQFGTSKFISPTQVVTYFSKGVGAILLSQLQRKELKILFRNLKCFFHVIYNV
jgi:hypothetical protein